MKFTLRCANDHEFESWFGGNDAYEKLVAANGIVCPECGTTDVEKALMAPRLSASAKKGGQEVLPPEKGVAAMPVEARVREALRQLQRTVEENSDYVGDRFADEALRIHHGETEARNIYGEATRDEHEKLSEEGVDFHTIPWLPKSDA
jgi:hypothetical protein